MFIQYSIANVSMSVYIGCIICGKPIIDQKTWPYCEKGEKCDGRPKAKAKRVMKF